MTDNTFGNRKEPNVALSRLESDAVVYHMRDTEWENHKEEDRNIPVVSIV